MSFRQGHSRALAFARVRPEGGGYASTSIRGAHCRRKSRSARSSRPLHHESCPSGSHKPGGYAHGDSEIGRARRSAPRCPARSRDCNRAARTATPCAWACTAGGASCAASTPGNPGAFRVGPQPQTAAWGEDAAAGLTAYGTAVVTTRKQTAPRVAGI